MNKALSLSDIKSSLFDKRADLSNSSRPIQLFIESKKQALFEGWLNPQPTPDDPDPWRRRIDSTFNHVNGSTLMGGVTGGIPGAVVANQMAKQNPVQSSKLNRKILDNVVSPALGRVATNTIDPYGYGVENKLQQYYNLKDPHAAGTNIGLGIRGIIKDNRPLNAERDELFRNIFNMPPRTGPSAEGLATYHKRPDKGDNAFGVSNNQNKSLTEELQNNVSYIINPTGMGPSKEELGSLSKEYMDEGMPAIDAYAKDIQNVTKNYPMYHPIVGRYVPNVRIGPRGTMTSKVNDTWNLSLNPGETITKSKDSLDLYGTNKEHSPLGSNMNLPNALRHAVTKITGGRAPTVHADLNLGNVEDYVRHHSPGDVIRHPRPNDTSVSKPWSGNEAAKPISTLPKVALFEGLLNPVATTADPDPWKRRVDAVFNHENGSALMGALAGGTIGGLSHLLPSDKKKPKMSVWKKILAGTAIGGATGYGLAAVAPDSSKVLNRGVIDNILLKPVGRVVTNTFDPYNYNMESHKDKDIVADPNNPDKKLKAPVGIMNYIKNVWNDDAGRTHDRMGEHSNANFFSEIRDQPYRYMFNLPARSGTDVYENMPGGKPDDYLIPKSIEKGSEPMFQENVKKQVKKQLDKLEEVPPDIQEARRKILTDAAIRSYDVNLLGNYSGVINNEKLNDGEIVGDISDRWNVGLNKNDKLTLEGKGNMYDKHTYKGTNLSKSTLFRYLVDNFTGGRSMNFHGSVNGGKL